MLTFTFDGRTMQGREGDTLAAALLRNGVRITGHSVDLGRPRGVFSAGSEEPNALVKVGPDPMVAATTVELFDGLAAWSLRGKGRIDLDAVDDRRNDKGYLHCDVLVIGGGPAGLAAAHAAGEVGARVILMDDQPRLGGDLLNSKVRLDGAPALDWVDALELKARVLTRTTAIGYYDHNYVVAVERRARGGERLWHVRARRVVLATGAHERSIAFPGNDRPGVMLASAARTYANRYGALPGSRAVVFACADSGYEAARDLAEAGVEIAEIVDPRVDGSVVTGTTADADGVLTGVRIGDLHVEADLLAVAGGWNPAIHLFSQSQGRARFDEELQAFVPHLSAQAERSAGACRGWYGTAEAIADGYTAGSQAAELAGIREREVFHVPRSDEDELRPPARLWVVEGAPEQAFVDLHRDVTVADVARAAGTGMRSAEHIKRYTTAGTGADQGKTSGVLVAGVVSALTGTQAGPTTFRPPYAPVSFATLAGRDRGPLSDPIRTTSMHDAHVARGALFEDVGQWKRPWYFPQDGESMHDAVARECLAARTDVAAMDASTLGKIDIRGGDAAEFLDRIYTNLFSTLAVGSCRYGLMCKADGMVFDDGVTTRLAEDRFLMTTTTGNAAAVLDWLEEWHQTEWPSLDVSFTSVTDHWATVAVVGPHARRIIAAIAPDAVDLPFMTFSETTVMGVAGRVFRISFSGELAFEVNVPWAYGRAVWEAVLDLGAVPYGTETMHVLRAEKGFAIVGQDTDGTVTPQDLGMSWIVSKRKPDYVGKRSHARPDTARTGRKRMVGLLADVVVPEGAQVVSDGSMLGHVTSSYPGATLALVKDVVVGDRLVAVSDGVSTPVTVTEPVFYDKDNLRRDGEDAGQVSVEVSPAQAISPASAFASRFAEASNESVRLRELPPQPMWEVRGEDPGRGLRLGPAWWLVVGGQAADGWVDVSGQRTVLELSGPDAVEVLITGCPADVERLDGHVQTLLAKTGVILERTDQDAFRIYVRSSFTSYLSEWLLGALNR
ncbi:2Fe-2S iron-sulfur cluster-binding protein [Nonomuraea sp. NPDC050556]|uniref:2Fe-2S iron-sulfur cluster-binding protein n=1 Tax=Nonomuraea sp. NPDC050556 TaxID=3364369 RepID=UPI0037BC709B